MDLEMNTPFFLLLATPLMTASPCSLWPTPSGLLPLAYSLWPTPSGLLPLAYSLWPTPSFMLFSKPTHRPRGACKKKKKGFPKTLRK